MASSLARSTMIVGVFSALSVVGGFIKLPSPVGSIALDSAAGFFVAAYYSPPLGALVGAVGHIGSAATAGMPLGPLHAVVSGSMAVICFLFGYIARRSASPRYLIVSGIIAVALNAFALPMFLTLFELPRAVAFSIMPLLLVAAVLNIFLASVTAWSSSKFRPGA